MFTITDKSMERKSPPVLSTLLYGLSIGIFLFHIHLLTAPVSDLAFYLSALVIAFTAGRICTHLHPRFRPWTPLFLLLFPWFVKALLLLVSFIVPGQAFGFDRALLFFDRNFFVVLLPFYWMAASAYMAGLSFRALHWNRIINGVLVLAFFLIIKSRQLTFYLWPTQLLAVFALIVLLQFAALMTASPLNHGPRLRRNGAMILLLLLLGSLAIFLVRKPAEEQATEQGGGLIKPDLFRFDFSQFLRLESEISLKEDLVLIVHKDEEDSHIFIRRYILSGYDTKKGFYRDPVQDEVEHPQELPPAELVLQTLAWQDRRSTEQEYFFVNFDPAAFIGMNSPHIITPLKTWDTTSFSSAYRVLSETSEAMPFQLLDAVPEVNYATTHLGLSEQEYRWYTSYGKDPRIKELGDSITEGLQLYWEKVQSIYEYLKHGDYRYSLKPGIASDGDQLGRFLFETKRGYCSYFAFSMALLLRSQGIPARVAVGFFINPDTGAFNYYPILSNMAHAWVEVYFPDYGWIEYDPTTTFLAEGEQFRFSQGAQQETFERLLGEILQNRDKLAISTQETTTPASPGFPDLLRNVGHWLQRQWLPITVALYILTLLILRYSYYVIFLYHELVRKNSRQATILLFKHSLRILRLAGLYKPGRTTPTTLQERIAQMETERHLNLMPLLALYQRACFSNPDQIIPETSLHEAYDLFSVSYRKQVPVTRRFLALLFPFLPWVLWSGRSRSKVLIAVIFIGSLLQVQSSLGAQVNSSEAQALEMLQQAQRSRQEERWEQAISILQKAETLFPQDSRFPAELGDIYNTRNLYTLAWNEYKRAEQLDPENNDILYQLSSVAGRLNKNDESIRYLQKLLVRDPDNKDAIGDLGWMFFKTHRLTEGEQLLTAALQRLGSDQGLEMTLATIYAEQYRYEDAKFYYEEAIKHAEKSGFKLFVSVAYYNLSILESRFYHFADAFNSTRLSLQYAERASGHLARGELYQRRLDFIKAQTEYVTAYELDTSPLSNINLAQLYQQAGNMEDARSYAEKTIQNTDLSWMVNYGTDIDRYKKDLHKILIETYKGLANLQNLRYKANYKQHIPDRFQWMKYTALQYWQEQLFSYYTIKAADAYRAENQELDALLHYYLALKRYPWRAKAYLVGAMDYETRLIKASTPTYLYELGSLEQNPELLLKAIDQFDPVWERDMIADAYAELAKAFQRQGRNEQAQASIEGLYALNRGALSQRGLRLPINLDLKGDFTDPRAQQAFSKVITGIVNGTGLEVLDSKALTSGRSALRYTLTINRKGNTLQCALFDTVKGSIIKETDIFMPDLSGESRSRFSEELRHLLFSEL